MRKSQKKTTQQDCPTPLRAIEKTHKKGPKRALKAPVQTSEGKRNSTPKPFKVESGTPIDPLKVPRFGGIATFSRLPFDPNPAPQSADIAILGVPFDGGTSYRPGARFAPRTIRAASSLNRNYSPDQELNLYANAKVIDAGDVAVNPISVQKTLQAIDRHCTELYKRKLKLIVLGGDHSIVLGELRAIKKIFGKPVIIHFDAHNDTGDQAWGEKFHHGTPFRRAIEEGLIEGKDLFQIGIRGPLTDASQYSYVREQKINMLKIDEFYNEKTKSLFLEKLKNTAKGRPCFISFDVDGVDPAFAPGTGTPVVGGMTSREALVTLRELKGLNIVGADIVEVCPAYDVAEITSLLAAAVAFEIMCLMAGKK